MTISVGTEKTAYEGKVASLQGKQMWTVTKDGQKVRIVDMDGDGKFTTKDKILDTGILNAEDVFEVSAIVQDEEHGGEGLSGELDTQYTAFKKAAEERDAAQADYDLAQRKAKLAQRQASQPKKKSFFDKVMPWLNLTSQAAMTAGTIYGAVKGDFWGLGMLGGCNWAFNGGNMADMAGLGFTGLSNAALLNSQLGSNNALWNSMGLNLSGMTGGAAGMPTQEKAALTAAQNKVDAIIGNAGKTSDSDAETKADAAKQKQAAKDVDAIRATLTTGKKSTEYPQSNLEYLNTHFPPSKDASTYTDEDIAIINQMKATPFVPIESIDVDGNGDKPISKEFAKKINEYIAEYFKDDNNNTTESDQYKSIKAILDVLSSDKPYITKMTPESIQKYIDWCMTDYGSDGKPNLKIKNPN